MPVLSGANRGLRWVAGSLVAKCWIGNYERHVQRIVAEHVRPGTVAYDIGANVGFFTLQMARAVGPEGHVFAFEPEPCNLNHLTRHLALNGIGNVTVVQAAVSESCGLAGFRERGANSGFDENARRLVPTISLDDFVRRGFPPPRFAKMDIEGAELPALSGAQAILAERRCTWIIAAHSDGLLSDCQSRMRTAGYATTPIGHGEDGWPEYEFLATP